MNITRLWIAKQNSYLKFYIKYICIIMADGNEIIAKTKVEGKEEFINIIKQTQKKLLKIFRQVLTCLWID